MTSSYYITLIIFALITSGESNTMFTNRCQNTILTVLTFEQKVKSKCSSCLHEALITQSLKVVHNLEVSRLLYVLQYPGIFQ